MFENPADWIMSTDTRHGVSGLGIFSASFGLAFVSLLLTLLLINPFYGRKVYISIKKCFQVSMAYLYPTAHWPLKAMRGAGPDESLTRSFVRRWSDSVRNREEDQEMGDYGTVVM